MVQNRNSLEFLNDKPKQTKPTRIPETIQNLVIGSHIKKSRHYKPPQWLDSKP